MNPAGGGGRWIVCSYSHCLEVALVALAQFGADLALGSRHVVQRALDGDDPLHVETAHVAQAAVVVVVRVFITFSLVD